jgi:hypothetical protein
MKPNVQKILTKLGKEKVELANVNQLSSLVKKSRDEEGEMIDSFLDAKASSKKGIKAAEKHIRNLKEVKSLVNDVESAAKELGVDALSIKEWKKAKDFLNGNPINATEIIISKMKSLL